MSWNNVRCFSGSGYWHQRADEMHGKKTGCWFVGDDDLTGALHDL